MQLANYVGIINSFLKQDNCKEGHKQAEINALHYNNSIHCYNIWLILLFKYSADSIVRRFEAWPSELEGSDGGSSPKTTNFLTNS